MTSRPTYPSEKRWGATRASPPPAAAGPRSPRSPEPPGGTQRDQRRAGRGELETRPGQRFRDEEDARVGIPTAATGEVFCAYADPWRRYEGSVGTFGGTSGKKLTINSSESGMELFAPPSPRCTGRIG